jgi:DNA-binding NarL/FixJ family response regulator
MFWRKKDLSSYRRNIPRQELRRRSRLLVIDDERPTLIDDLQRSGFAVDYQPDITSHNLSLLDSGTYDLILLDFANVGTTLGQDHGLTLLRYIKRANPATFVVAYTSKSLGADHADFYRNADGVLPKDAGIADSIEKIEDSLQKAIGVENVWRGLLNLSGISPGSDEDKIWQDMAARGIEKANKLSTFKAKVVTSVKSEAARSVALSLIEKLVEAGVKSALGA